MRSKSPELMLKIRDFIEEYFDRHSSTPTVREIAGAMKVSASSAHRYLVALAERDMVTYEGRHLTTHKNSKQEAITNSCRRGGLHSLRNSRRKGSSG